MTITTAWNNMIHRSMCITVTVLLINHSYCDRDLTRSVKLFTGSMIDIDYWSAYRLPNQSTVCDQFINSYYLDDPKEENRYVTFAGSLSSSPTVASRGVASAVSSAAAAAASASASSTLSSSSSSNLKTAGSQLWDRHKPSNWISTVEFDPTALVQLPKTEKQHLYDYNQRFKNILRSRQPTLYTFTSPLYPDNYPPNVDCIKVIKAPQEDQQIVLDFRGPYQFEQSAECINDYLEVRDGEYGFSPLIGRFCSDNRQLHSIKSNGQWLRLRFHSDFSIEKSGFQAVYYFTKLRGKEELLPQKPIISTTISIEDEVTFEHRDLLNLWRDYTNSIIKTKSHPVDRLTEFIIDFRTNRSDLILMIHLSLVKFQIIDPECRTNIIEIYDEFFLTDKDAIPKTPSILSKISKGSQVVQRVNEKYTPRMIHTCNKKNLEPYTCKLGRGVVRILVSPEPVSVDPMEYTQTNATKSITKLPEIKLTATVLKNALCEDDWIPCVRPIDYIAYKEYYNLTVRSKPKDPTNGTDDKRSSNKNIKKSKYASHSSKLQTTTMKTTVVSAVTESSKTNAKDTVIALKSTILQSHPTLPKTIYCLPPNLVCNGHWNCPNGEDEDKCPRPPNGLEAYDVFVHEHNLSDEMPTEIIEEMVTTERLDSISSSSEDDDEFHHHTPIIAALESSGSLSNLKSLQINNCKCETISYADDMNKKVQVKESTYNVTVNTTFTTPVSTTTVMTTTTTLTTTDSLNLNDSLKQEEIKPLKTSSDCSFLNCANLCSNSAPKSQDSFKQTTEFNDDDDIEKEKEMNDNEVTKHDLESTTSGLAEIFDRATKPLGYIHKLDSSPAWNQGSSQSTIQHLRETQKLKSTYNPYLHEYPTNRSLGQLPNTLVIPVDKLSKQYHHSPMTLQRPIHESYHKSKVSRSDPFSLKEQSAFVCNTDGSNIDEHLQLDNLRRSFSVRRIKDTTNTNTTINHSNNNNSYHTPYISYASLKQNTLPSGLLDYQYFNDKHCTKSFYQPRYSLEQQQQQQQQQQRQQQTSETNIFSILDSDCRQKQARLQQQKRKHFKGSAPKRAKHENNLMLKEQTKSNIPLYHQLLLSNGQQCRTKQHAHLINSHKLFDSYKSSQTTSVEILDLEGSNNPRNTTKHLLTKSAKPAGMTMTSSSITTTATLPLTNATTTTTTTSTVVVPMNNNATSNNVIKYRTKLFTNQNTPLSPSKTLWTIGSYTDRPDESSSCISQNDESDTTTTTTTTTTPPPSNDSQLACNIRLANKTNHFNNQYGHFDQQLDTTTTTAANVKDNNKCITSSVSPLTRNHITGSTITFDNLQVFKNSNEVYLCNCNLNSSAKYNFPSSYSVIQQTLSPDMKFSNTMRKNASWNDMSRHVEYFYGYDDDDDDDDVEDGNDVEDEDDDEVKNNGTDDDEEEVEDDDDDDEEEEEEGDEEEEELSEQINGKSEQPSEVDGSIVDKNEGRQEFTNPYNHSSNVTLPHESSSEESPCQVQISNHSTPRRQPLGTSVVIITSKGRTIQPMKII
uniref:CUB domain-containing protein n=1 Tax=Trichobilharzia regenti TaxID=157069 RepID=A0AA85J155_TRIRE|nr:unnamed protein product [Trichobilharzia regenti]